MICKCNNCGWTGPQEDRILGCCPECESEDLEKIYEPTKVYLNTTRTGYSPRQVGGTLTVGELVQILQQYDENSPVYFRNDNGYTYGGLDDIDTVQDEHWYR